MDSLLYSYIIVVSENSVSGILRLTHGVGFHITVGSQASF